MSSARAAPEKAIARIAVGNANLMLLTFIIRPPMRQRLTRFKCLPETLSLEE